MRCFAVLIVSLFAVCGWGQSAEDPEIVRAKAEIERLRGLVEAGAAPRQQLQKAEDAMADAQDAAVLRKTVYGQDLTEAQADDMIAAAARRLERRTKTYNAARKLVDAGAAGAVTLDSPRAEMDMARKECDLAASRANLVRELAQMASAEETYSAQLSIAPGDAHLVAERFDGDGVFDMTAFAGVESAFEREFGKPLPVSAMGETAVHRSMGFDHHGRVDVALGPDSPEGAWLRLYLKVKRIPFFAFRQAVSGKATGAHIHIGPMSSHLAAGG